MYYLVPFICQNLVRWYKPLYIIPLLAKHFLFNSTIFYTLYIIYYTILLLKKDLERIC